jgi:hydrogenase nickel incorporation protein HypA/HybF
VHELAITEAVVDAVVARTGRAPVTCVRLEIGRLSGVVPDAVRFCFDLACAGTPLAGARLEITEPPGRAGCRSCGAAFTVADPIVLCPACDSADVRVDSGRDLRILSVEVMRECAAPAAAPTRPESG